MEKGWLDDEEVRTLRYIRVTEEPKTNSRKVPFIRQKDLGLGCYDGGLRTC